MRKPSLSIYFNNMKNWGWEVPGQSPSTSRTVSDSNKWVLFCTIVWDSYLCCRKGDPFLGPRLCFCLTRGNDLSEETHIDYSGDFVGKGCLGREPQGKGNQEDCSATWLIVSGFMVMGFVSRLSLANYSQGPSWWHMHCSAKMDTTEEDSGRW